MVVWPVDRLRCHTEMQIVLSLPPAQRTQHQRCFTDTEEEEVRILLFKNAVLKCCEGIWLQVRHLAVRTVQRAALLRHATEVFEAFQDRKVITDYSL